MAIEKKYEEQMPFVGTGLMKARLDEEAGRRRVSIARIIRDMIDERYLLSDGEELDLNGQADLAHLVARRAQDRANSLIEQVVAQGEAKVRAAREAGREASAG